MDIRTTIRLIESAETEQGKTITLTYEGDCDLLGLLECIKTRGDQGAGTDILVKWGGGEERWYFDGDGHDRITDLTN